MAAYTLLPMRRWASTGEWSPFQLGERTQWKAVLRVALVTAGASLTVKLQASATGEESDWIDLVSFSAQTQAGITELDSSKIPTPDFTVKARQHVWIRAVIAAVTGEAVAEVTISAPFLLLAVQEDRNLLSKELRTWEDGLRRTLDEAERDIAAFLRILDNDEGRLDVDLTHPEVHQLIKLEVADQAEHLMRKAVLSRSHDPSALVTMRQMPRLFPGVGVRLRGHRSKGSFIWRGR